MAYYRDTKTKGEPIMHPIYCDRCAVIEGRLAFITDEYGDYWPIFPWKWSPYDIATVCKACGGLCGRRRIATGTEPAKII
jgi:hypothetical protein